MSIGQEPNSESVPKITTPEICALYDADPNSIIAACRPEKGKVVTFEVGCGNKLSVSLGPRDVWIGIDPDLQKGSRIKRGENVVCETSERFAVPGKLDEIPETANPDLLLMVAPNPDDINYNELLQEVKTTMKRGRTILLGILDTSSYESVANPETYEMDGYGLRLAKKKFQETFGENFEIEFLSTTSDKTDVVREHGIERTVHINSDFLFGKKKLLVVVTPRGGRR